MIHCTHCHHEISGIGRCDACGRPLCFLCFIEREQMDGTAVLCPKCSTRNEDVLKPRWKKHPTP